MDVSESMLAQDLKPSRLQRAKRELSDLLEHLQGDRLALLTFAGTAFIEVPLTNDYGMIHQFINELDPSLIPVPGTNISEALNKSLTALLGDQKQNSPNANLKRGKGIILITDGEDSNSDLYEIKNTAKKYGVKIYIIGVGTEQGAPIPTRNGYKRDRSENIVVSKLNVSALKSLAQETGGKFVASLGTEGDIISIYDEGIKTDLEGSITKGSKSKLWNEYFQYPLALGILFLILGMLIEQELIKFPLRKMLGKNV
jgi:Ca-activated chloride channel family protein